MTRPTLTPIEEHADADGTSGRARLATRAGIVVASSLVGLLLVAQVRAAEDFDARLEVEREENLTRILADLSDQRDELSRQIAEQRLLLFELEVNTERREVALDSLQQRLDDLRVLTGTVEVVGDEGIRLTIDDPTGVVEQDQVVDVIQELRDAGAEAIAVDDVRLVAQSYVATANDRLVVDGRPVSSPYVVEAIGPAAALAEGLAIPGGVETSLRSREAVGVEVERLGQVTLPAAEPIPFLFAEPVPGGESTG